MRQKYAKGPYLATMLQLAKAKGWSVEIGGADLPERTHDEELVSYTVYFEAAMNVSFALMKHPPGTVASIDGLGYWLAVHRDLEAGGRNTLFLTSARLSDNVLDADSVRFIRDHTGLVASEYDRITECLMAWRERRAYLEFDPEHLDALVARAYPAY
ncbi:hypothetical protein [Hydrogenophaga sp. BPS33]|uniref:hypothetical protein n=1 Tax=Hydrogenophaga sp. BPS33 TaxID=2651974 RepID=UPI00131F9886|nr:hypothetical protein [Hydrogenophaga sp. BPS33]QHE89228.1 hypothetical protein F9K07_30040 [Hydrogenophaga sp. BPS33]